MKFLKRLLFFFLFLLTISCSSDKEEKSLNEIKATYLRISNQYFYFEMGDGVQTLDIETDGN